MTIEKTVEDKARTKKEIGLRIKKEVTKASIIQPTDKVATLLSTYVAPI